MIKLKELLTEKREMKFVRYGGLSPVKQRGFNKSDTFHSPPARKGIYAFVDGYIEPFLLGGSYGDPFNKNSSNRFVYVRDKTGNKITSEHPDFITTLERGESMWERRWKLKPGATPDEDGEYSYDDYIHVLLKKVHPKKFKYDGEIWHHLKKFVPVEKIIRERGSWIKTDMETFKDAFAKNAHESRKDMNKTMGIHGWKPKNPLKFHTKDHLEVFIERP